MICTYKVDFSDGDSFRLQKQVAQKQGNLQMDQVVLIDKDYKIVDLNKVLTQTYMKNPKSEQIYTLLDLQQLIIEWSIMKKDNDLPIQAFQNQINELQDQIEKYQQEMLQNHSENQKNSNTIIFLRDYLEKLTQQHSQERQQLQDNLINLRFKLSEDAFQYEHTLKDLNDKLKIAVGKSKTQDNNQQNQIYEQKISELTEEKEFLHKKLKQVGQNVTQKAQKIKQELSKLKIDYSNLQFEKEQLQKDIDTFKQQCAALIKQEQVVDFNPPPIIPQQQQNPIFFQTATQLTTGSLNSSFTSKPGGGKKKQRID